MRILVAVLALIGAGFAGITIAGAAEHEPATTLADGAAVLRIGETTAKRAAHQATVLPSGHMLITGGCAGDGCRPFHSSTEIFDPTSRTFRSAAPMSVPRASHTAL